MDGGIDPYSSGSYVAVPRLHLACDVTTPLRAQEMTGHGKGGEQ